MQSWEYDILFFNAKKSIHDWIERECDIFNGQMNYDLSRLYDRYLTIKPL